jgi:hypothetical protein
MGAADTAEAKVAIATTAGEYFILEREDRTKRAQLIISQVPFCYITVADIWKRNTFRQSE